MPKSVKRPADRRVQKTQKLLRAALHELIREKCYDTISVKEILDRANVGRSTFYLHFRDKDELLVSGIYDMLETVHPNLGAGGFRERLISFSLPIFEFHQRQRHVGSDRMGHRGQAILHGQLRSALAQLISEKFEEGGPSGKRKMTSQLSPELLSQYLASSFTLVLDWWLESKSRLTPKEVDAIFRTLVEPALSGL